MSSTQKPTPSFNKNSNLPSKANQATAAGVANAPRMGNQKAQVGASVKKDANGDN